MSLTYSRSNSEQAMNDLLGHLEDKDPVFTRQDVFDAFEEADKDDPHYGRHIYSALKYNTCGNIQLLLDAACACDMLIEFHGEYIAIDWTDNPDALDSKVQKHRWLKPVYEYLGITRTLAVHIHGHRMIRNKSHEMVARLKASGELLAKIEEMQDKDTINTKLSIRIKTSFK